MVGLSPAGGSGAAAQQTSSKVKRTVVTRVCDAVKAIAVCHNVTPVYEAGNASDTSESTEQSDTEVDQQSHQRVSYQASSPDEVNVTYHISYHIKNLLVPHYVIKDHGCITYIQSKIKQSWLVIYNVKSITE